MQTARLKSTPGKTDGLARRRRNTDLHRRRTGHDPVNSAMASKRDISENEFSFPSRTYKSCSKSLPSRASEKRSFQFVAMRAYPMTVAGQSSKTDEFASLRADFSNCWTILPFKKREAGAELQTAILMHLEN